MRKRWNRLSALLLAAWLLAAPVLPALAVDGDAITISTMEDLRRFGKSCALDAWSRGKTVSLTADLDLKGEEFVPIPTFGGTFLGNGHTISGLRITAAGSTQGLFRYIQPGGSVRELTVKGTVTPAGTRSTVGGLAGVNEGTLQDCAFQGTVSGDSAVGGLVGRNGAGGQIIGCSVSGFVSGNSAAGGIAGRSLGLLLRCENRAGVNLTQTDSGVDLLDADAAAILEERASADDETYHLLEGCTDTGGIAGYSGGVIQSCVNSGPVGYPHVGYNTGGIAGRQDGYLADCVNSGAINGRKDVGGIVGQAEPCLVMDPGEDTLERLQRELDTLDRLINRALDSARRTGDEASARLEAMGVFAGDARDSSRALLDRLSDFTDENIGTVNTLAADLTGALDKISPALDDLSDVGGRLERLSRQLDRALESIGDAADTGGAALAILRSAAGDLRQGRNELSAAMKELQAALDRIYHAVFPDGTPTLPDSGELAAIREDIRRAFDDMQGAGNRLDGALSDLQRALREAGGMSDQLGDALEELQGGASSSADIGRLLRRAFGTIGGAVDELTRDGPTEFTPLGEDFRQSGDGLFNALSGLSGELEGLRVSVQSGGDTLNSDLRAVSRQFNVVFDVVLDALMDLNGDEGIGAVIQDTSEEDIAATREGKVTGCRNTGTVEGDRNVGGVVGAVAVEVDLDPEDDITGQLSFGATYETKAVVHGCVNQGAVSGKKDCVGGVAGRMDLGTALDCQNYGPASSTGGDYVGGIAGYADASIRSCWSKNVLSGGNYVGGIAGWVSRLRDCRAIATIEEGTEYLGALAGWVEEDGVLSGNRFVDTGWAGVDGVSYAGRAEPISFEELSRLPDVPAEFTAFTLNLVAGGQTVARIPFLYGEDLSRVVLPPVPEVEDSYGLWPEFDTSGLSSDITLEAEYIPWVTLAASQELSGKLSLALAEGRFTEQAVLHVADSAQAPPREAGEGAVVWEVTLTDSGLEAGDAVPLRLLSPEGGEALVWQYEDGRWQQSQAVLSGRYLLLTMSGPQGTFCIQPQADGSWAVPAAAAGIGAAAILLTAVAVKRKKAARAARARREAEEKEKAGRS